MALAAASLLFGGCSYSRPWKAALRQPIPAGDISGPWEGRWLSDKNGHTGRLRCIMTATGTNGYNAHFHATFWKIFRASYQVPFAATNAGTRFTFTGESNLGKLAGGTYTYAGSADPSNFSATYRSKYDQGTFEMKRPAPPAEK